MKNKPSKKAGEVDEGIMMLVALCLILFVFILPKSGVPGPAETLSVFSSDPGQAWQTSGSNPSYSSQSTTQNGETLNQTLSLGSGNASYEIQAYLEYITLYNQSDKPLDISGWKLQNAKDTRGYQIGSDIRNFAADTAVIPSGSPFVSPNGHNALKDIIIGPGERAIVTTGSIGVKDPYKIESFKENKCSGYLESMPEYSFTPSLDQNCPRPQDEIGFNKLDRACQDLLNNFSSCHIPTYDGYDSNHQACKGCIDGHQNLTNACVAFIKSHFDYGSCIDNHQGDPDFAEDTWRIFLGQNWEMWAKDHETISLFNRSSQKTSSLSY